jgi:hypothetical protein
MSEKNQINQFNINIQNIIYEIRHKYYHNKELEVDDDLKERIIDIIYNLDGFYSIQRSYQILFGSLFKDKNKITLLFYTIILSLMMFMFVSIYLTLYNFFINKTLVVNIFLQVK